MTFSNLNMASILYSEFSLNSLSLHESC